MNTPKIVGSVVAGVMVACIAFGVGLLLIKWMWAWTIPDLFPAAVAQGFIAGAISWRTAAKIALCIAILSGLAGGRQAHARRREGPLAH